MHNIVDETNGPGRPVITGGNLQEIWEALGHEDGRSPTLDEVLHEIRALKSADPVEFIPQSTLDQPSVSWGAFGMTVVGFSADDVLKIRAAYKAEQQK